ncbi:transposase [Streptosporangium sp. NPDC002607]
MEYSRGTDKTWVYGALRIRDGTELTFCAPSRNSDGWIQLLEQIGKANRRDPIVVITDNLSSHFSWRVRQWLARHPRIRQVFIPIKACWLTTPGRRVGQEQGRDESWSGKMGTLARLLRRSSDSRPERSAEVALFRTPPGQTLNVAIPHQNSGTPGPCPPDHFEAGDVDPS